MIDYYLAVKCTTEIDEALFEIGLTEIEIDMRSNQYKVKLKEYSAATS